MAESEHNKLDELLELTRENNSILRSMHRKQVLGQIMTFFYWLFILGAAGWSYYYFKPYMDKYIDMYQNISTSLKSLDSIGTELPSDLNNILEKVR